MANNEIIEFTLSHEKLLVSENELRERFQYYDRDGVELLSFITYKTQGLASAKSIASYAAQNHESVNDYIIGALVMRAIAEHRLP